MKRRSTGTQPPKSSGAPQGSADWRSEDPNVEHEQSRYTDPIASREFILKALTEAPEPLTAARLAKRLGLESAAQRAALEKRLAAMVRDGQAIEGPNGFAAAGEGERVAGRVRGRANGDVLVLPDDGSAPLVMARADTATLMHNDRVEVLAVGMNAAGASRASSAAPAMLRSASAAYGRADRISAEWSRKTQGTGIPSRCRCPIDSARATAIT